MALKASTGANESIFKRRWRKIAGDQDDTDTTPQRPKKATVNIEDVIRAKQEKLAAEAKKKELVELETTKPEIKAPESQITQEKAKVEV